MKKGIVLLLLVSSVCVKAQSLKDALYGGKLKNSSGTVIRKGDDLTAKVDTAQQKQVADTIAQSATNSTTATAQSVTPVTDSAATATDVKDRATTPVDTAETVPAANTVAAPKTNNALLKTYMDSVATVLKTEALSSKKAKRGDYYASVAYTIDTAGMVTFGDVTVSPENSFLQQQIKERLASENPHLNPVLSDGKPHKVSRRYNFTLTKE